VFEDLDDGRGRRSGAAGPAPTGIPDDFVPVVPFDRSFDAVYGLELIDDGAADGVVRGRVAIGDHLRQPFGLLHGGVIATVAEALASRGTWIGVNETGVAVMGMSNDTNFLRPLTEGFLTATATPRHRGRTRWLWQVESRDDQGRLCAVTTVNIAVRRRRD
jgi:1,4-dihydroxy-2-naphthoyl-CoA hydrolase